jgi:slit protein 2
MHSIGRIVSFNKLGCVERDALYGLSSLRILSLHGNDVSFIPEGTFRDIASDTHVWVSTTSHHQFPSFAVPRN